MTILTRKCPLPVRGQTGYVTSLVVLRFGKEHKQTTAEPPSETKSFEDKYKIDVLSF